MPTEVQKAMGNDLSNLPNTYVILDDILIVTTGTKDNHHKAGKRVLGKLNKANVRLKWGKCNIARDEIE